MAKARLSPQTRQEYVSRDSFSGKLSAQGWVVNSFERDQGHDFNVHIYNPDGEFSGLQFVAQLKSTASPDFLASQEAVAYEFETDDFAYWEASVPANVLCLWDVAGRRGWWIDVDSAARELDERSPGWRERSTVRVRFPLAHDLEREGLRALRALVRKKSMPMIAQDRPLRMTLGLSFPADAEGQRKAQELRDLLDRGTTVEIDAKYIRRLVMPDWYRRTLEPSERVPSALVVSSNASRDPLPVRLMVPSEREGAVEIPYLELRRQRAGRKEVVLAGSDPSGVLTVTLTLSEISRSTRLELQYKQRPAKVQEALQVARFLRALGEFRVLLFTFLQKGAPVRLDVPEGAVPLMSEDLVDVLEKLLVIEQRCTVSFRLPARWYPTRGNRLAIEEAYRACTEGVVPQGEGEGEVTIQCTLEECERIQRQLTDPARPDSTRERVEVAFGATKTVTIYQKKVPLGPYRQAMNAERTRVVEVVREALDAMTEGGRALRFPVRDVRTHYLRWALEGEAAREVTLADAAAG